MTGRALVTGASGLVGSHIVERLIADGWGVRALTRKPGRDAWLAMAGAELTPGDILDPESMRAAAAGCTHVFHCAAAVTPRSGGLAAYRSLNVDGTRNVLTAAADAGARLLHLSSVAVYGPAARYRREPTDERAPLAPLDDPLYYARTKRESEDLVLEAHAKGTVWAAVIRPCVVYGRRDRQFVPRIAGVIGRGILPLPGGGRAHLPVIHAGNVAHGAVLAATSDLAGGKPYNIANEEPVTGREFFRLAAAGMERRLVIVPIPAFVARLGMLLLRLAIRVAYGGGAAAMSRGSLAFVTRGNPFSSERARRELGWSPVVSPRDSIPDAFRWWRQQRATG